VTLASALSGRLSAAVRSKPFAIHLKRPIVSFTFDDASRSAVTVGARILEAHDALGTFYVAGGLVGAEEQGTQILTEEQLVRLNEEGHELGCQTFSHVRVSSLSPSQFRAEIDRNQAFISSLCGDVRLTNFAYPFGEVSLSRKLQVQSAFASGRGISPGVNSGTADLGSLKAAPLRAEGRGERAVEAYLERAGRDNGWLIFYAYDIDPDPSVRGATPEQLEMAVAAARDRGYDILTVRNALGRLAAAALY
jgi:peptidoglycan/xylan/chitin deacetylase (PgdA/CDA1 family)